MLMCQQMDKAEKELDRCIRDEENKLSRLNDMTEKYETAMLKYDEIRSEFQKLEVVKDDYIKIERQRKNPDGITQMSMKLRESLTETRRIVKKRKRSCVI